MGIRKDAYAKTWKLEKLEGKLRVLFFLMVAFCVICVRGLSVNAEEIVEGGIFTCEEGTGSAQWVLNSDGDLVLSGTGTINNLGFPTSEDFRLKVKNVYCSTPMVCNTYMDLEGVFSDMSNVESINLKLMSIPSTKSVKSMFSGCSNLKCVNMQNVSLKGCEYSFKLANGNTERKIYVDNMFKGCTSLEEIYMASGYLGELPELSSGYQWENEDGELLRNTNYYKTGNHVVYNGLGGKVSKTPIKYSISYSYTTYDKSEDGLWYYDNEKGIMVSDVWGEGKGVFSGITRQKWENNNNPLYYTVEDGLVTIQSPTFTVDGYELVNYSPKVIDTSDLKSVEVQAFFLPKENGKEGNVTTEENSSSTTTESTTKSQTTEQATITEKSTEVATSTSGNTSESVTTNNDVVSINDAKSTKTSIKSASNSKGKKIKLSLKEFSGYKYQIKVSTSKKFSKNVKTYTTSKSSYTISKLQKGKNYYIKVRTFKSIDGNNVYGKWSAVKKVKVKK